MKRRLPLLINILASIIACAAPALVVSQSSPHQSPSVAALATASATSTQPQPHKRFKILLVQGANLSYLGRREPDYVGSRVGFDATR